MKDTLKLSLIQTTLEWENPAANRLQFARLLEALSPGSTDIIMLPEMFTTGFSMSPDRIAEPFSGTMDTLQWMRVWAGQLDSVIAGSIAVKEGDRFFNRLMWVRPDGTYTAYDKRHLFQMAGEHHHYSSGNKLLIEEWQGWKICPLICYDLRFPVWGRNRMTTEGPMYDVLLYVANWPAVRREPWMKLALARAIENQCYTAAVNRIGTDGNGLDYCGDSAVIDPRGNYILSPVNDQRIMTAELSAGDLKEFRMKFPVLTDADLFELTTE
jgi:predicted amidohydrolase